MKLRKLFPGLVVTLLAIVLSVGLFTGAIPKVLATEVTEEEPLAWCRTASGYVYGTDRTIYSYSYSLIFEKDVSDDVEGEYDRVSAHLEIENETIETAVWGMYCIMEMCIYDPVLDDYVIVSGAKGTDNREAFGNCYEVMTNLLEYDEGSIEGEIEYVTARYYFADRMVGSLSWYRES